MGVWTSIIRELLRIYCLRKKKKIEGVLNIMIKESNSDVKDSKF